MAKINCMEIFVIPSKFLSICGQLHTRKLTKGIVLKIILNTILNSVIVFLIILNIYVGIKLGDIKLVNFMTGILVPATNYVVKNYTLFINKSSLLALLDIIKSDAFNSHTKELNQHVKLVYRISKIMMRYFFLTAVVVLLIFAVLPIVMNIRMMIPPPFEMGPFDIPYKVAILVSTFYMAGNSTCFDVFYMCLMGVCIAQLNILEARLSKVFQDLKIAQTGKKSYSEFENMNKVAKRNLRNCLILYETIIQFTESLNILLAFPLFIQYTCGCFVICNAVMQITIMGEAGTSNIIGMCGYSGLTLGQMTVYHWLGNEIMFKSNKIMESCYLSNWYNANIECRRILILLMERAKKPLVIELYSLVIVSLDSLAVIFRWAYSIFALIKAEYN